MSATRHGRGPTAALFHLAFGRALAFCGWPDGAVNVVRDALALDPSLVEARVGLAEALGKVGRWEEACAVLEQASASRPSDADLQAALVVALCRSGRGHDCVAALRRLVDLRPHQAELHVLLGALLRRLHRSDEAIRSFRWATQLPLAPHRFVLGEMVLGEAGWDSVLQSLRGAPRQGHEALPLPRGRTVLQQPPPSRDRRPRS